jgi:hypothetical protein
MSNEYIPKIDKSYLEMILKKESSLKYFGNWINDINKLKNSFLNSSPFEHIIIDNFLEESYAEKMYNFFPNVSSKWYEYKNPIEVKYTFDNINELSTELKNYFYYLSTPEFINIISNISNINDLEYDEYLHGAGLHSHPRYGRLNIHLDYEKHPFSGKERRLNIILFMSKDWDDSWNGSTELWDSDVTNCIVKTQVKFNRAILFKTNDISWHGLPEKIMCPEHIFRNSLAYYFVSPLNTKKNEDDYRKKAKFIKRPEDPFNEKIEELYNIRPLRRITQTDLNLLIPDWTIES